MKSHVNAQAEQTRQTDAASTTANAQPLGIAAFVDNRPESLAQHQLQKMADNSAQVMQHKASSSIMNNGARMAAQGKSHTALFGGAVQQTQGRVKPALQMKGMKVNDDAGLENEADVMGARAADSSVMQNEKQANVDMPGPASFSRSSNESAAHIGTLVANEFTQAVQGKADPALLGKVRQRVQAEISATKFIVEDKDSPGPGQIGKSVFLSSLSAQIRQTAEQILAQIGQSADDCPYIPHWFDYYQDKDIAHIEEAIGRYAPGAMGAADWTECIQLVTQRVRQGFEKHVNEGSMEGVPDELPADLHEKQEPEPMKSPIQEMAIQRCGTSNQDEPSAKEDARPKRQIGNFDAVAPSAGKKSETKGSAALVDPLSTDAKFDPKSKAVSSTDQAQIYKGREAAKAYIATIPSKALKACKRKTVEETAALPQVHEWLSRAMVEYGKKQSFPASFSDLGDLKTFGLQGNCMDVSPIFGYLLNRIMEQPATSVYRPKAGGVGEDLGGAHTMLVTTGATKKYIDATWRQGGGDGKTDMDGPKSEDPRTALPMVRVSEEVPTMQNVDAAVKKELAKLGAPSDAKEP